MTEEKKILINYRLEKAYKTLDEAKYQMTGEMWNLAINRLYYSCYYSVTALLFCIDLNPKTHKGTHNLFHQHFILTKKLPNELAYTFSSLFDARQESDYKDYVEFKNTDVIPLIEQTKNFLDYISKYVKEHLSNLENK